MSTFEVLIRRVTDVFDHPNADSLVIAKVLGYEAIVTKSATIKTGDLIVYVPEATVVPEDVLREYGFWRTTSDGSEKGMLAGKAGNRVKIIELRKRPSQGLILPLKNGAAVRGSLTRAVKEGDDVADFFGFTKYEPPIPAAMSGDLAAVAEMAFGYDIENWQNFPGFLDNDEVVAVEKCHGTNFRICFHPMVSRADLFGEGGQVGIASKSQGAEGKMFKNNRVNLGELYTPSEAEIAEDRRLERRWERSKLWGFRHYYRWRGIRVPKPVNYKRGNLYVRAAHDFDLIEKITALGKRLNQRVDLFGEVFGAGVQNLQYGQSKPVFRAFDIAIDRKMCDEDEKVAFFAELGVERLPVLYRGPWNEAALVQHRDGKTTISGTNIREGIVVTALGDQSKRDTPDGRFRLRPFLKMVSPAYLKTEDGTEIQ